MDSPRRRESSFRSTTGWCRASLIERALCRNGASRQSGVRPGWRSRGRKAQADAQARTGVRELELGLVQLGHRAGEAEAEAVSRRRAVGLQPDEPAQRRLAL